MRYLPCLVTVTCSLILVASMKDASTIVRRSDSKENTCLSLVVVEGIKWWRARESCLSIKY